MNKKPAIFFFLSTSVIAQTAYAAEDNIQELEEIVVTAPLQDKASESAVPVTVLSDDELRLKVGHSIGETLKNELGIPASPSVQASAPRSFAVKAGRGCGY